MEKFSSQELAAMELDSIIIMHNSIGYPDDNPLLLSIDCYDDEYCLNANYDAPDVDWGEECGFAFIATETDLNK